MSWRLSADALDYSPYEGRTLLVLIALCSWAHDDGCRIFPRVETVAQKARCSVRQAQRALRQLETDGVLVVVKKGGGRSVTEYRIDIVKLRNGHGCQNGTGDKTDSQIVENVTPEVPKPAAHIDNRSGDSVIESVTLARDGEVVGRRDLWPAFQRWPGKLPASASEARTLSALDRLKDPPSIPDLLACIEAQGVEYERVNADRRQRRQGDEPLMAPHNWLEKVRGFEKYLTVVRERPSRIAAGVEKARRVMEDLGAEVHAGLRRARLTEGEISSLGGVTFDPGPPAIFGNLTPQQEKTLRLHHQDLDDIWPGVRFSAGERRTA